MSVGSIVSSYALIGSLLKTTTYSEQVLVWRRSLHNAENHEAIAHGLPVPRQEGQRSETVVMVHEAILCAQEPPAIRLKALSWLQLLLKCRHVYTVKQSRWIHDRRTLPHERWPPRLSTVVGLGHTTADCSCSSQNLSSPALSHPSHGELRPKPCSNPSNSCLE